MTISSMMPQDRLVVDRLSQHEGAVQDDGGERGREDLEVDVGRDLAALLGSLVDLAGLAELDREEALVEGVGELHVVLQRGDDAGHDGQRALVADAAVVARDRHQVAAQRAGVDRR